MKTPMRDRPCYLPAALRIWGLRTRIYETVRNVESPARSSIAMELPRSEMRKCLGGTVAT